MYLQELELGGFKSFAKKTELEFATSITAIVGPNGSGKSNVAEAFRFVLGEQSIKSMRGKRGEDLIWGGSSSVARANRASVKIALNNEPRVFPVDFDTVTIERIVHRDGVNEYLINGSRARLKDVQELLAAANIGPSGHHIISQGEADRILAANPKERRETIEDALGLKVYQYKKVESEKKLAKTRENIAHVASLRKEVQPHLRFLERQVKKVERAEKLREELAVRYAAYLKREALYIAHHTERVAQEKLPLSQELERLGRDLADARAVLERDERDDTRDALVALESKIEALRTRRQEALRASGEASGKISYLKRAADARHERHEHAAVPFAEVEKLVHSVDRVADSAKAAPDIDEVRRILESVVRMLRSFLNEASRSTDAHTDMPDASLELAELEREKQQLDEALRAIEQDETAIKHEYESLKASIETERGASRDAERAVFRIMEHRRELEHSLAELERDEQALLRDREDHTREIAEAVALLGRAAAAYKDCTVDEDGAPLEPGRIIAEDRQVQRERHRMLEKMKIRLEELGAAGGEEIMKEYRDVQERDAFLAREIEDLERSSETLEALIADLATQLATRFDAGVEKISAEFNRFFMLMFGGGRAALMRTARQSKRTARTRDASQDDDLLEDSEDEPAETENGVDIDVALPNKRVRGLEMLSGGERALTSIALIFAMSQVNPPLFVILDETDAALDEANSRRYGDMIEELAKRSQLILITHNRETMSRAGVLYGVTMGSDGVSKLLSVKFDEAVAVAK